MTVYAPMRMRLETERLRLEPWAESDAENLCALHREREGLEWTPSVERARQLIADGLARTETTGLSLLAIRRRDEGDFIGYCGLIVGRCSVEEPEIAYELFRRVHGHGYATEAACAVVEAVSTTGRERLWSTVRSWNAPSLRVLDKLGFGRDHVTVDDKGEIVWLTRALPQGGPSHGFGMPQDPVMPVPSRLEQRIHRDFSDPETADGIIAALDRLPDDAGHDEEMFRSERIRAAIVLLANGDSSRFRDAVELAKTDWRDLLVAAGLAREDWPARLEAELNPRDFDDRPGPGG